MSSWQVLRFFLLLLTGFTDGTKIISTPIDATGKVGESAQFTCELAPDARKVLTWYFNGKTVYDYQSGNELYHGDQHKYSVTHEDRRFVLSIKNLNFSDGGEYTCDTMGDQMATAVLIVLENPQLTSLTSNFEEGSVVTYQCEARFGGPTKKLIPAYQYPQLTMLLDGENLEGNTNERHPTGSDDYYLFTQVQDVTLDSINRKLLTCNVQTTFPVVMLTAKTVITVLYAVRDVDYYPKKEHYLVGDIVNCTADGNPPPSYQWDNTETSGDTFDTQLQLTEEMVGRENSWRCIATNVINDVSHHLDITIDFDVASTKDSDPITATVVTVIVIILIAIAIAVVLILYRRRKNQATYSSVATDDGPVCGLWSEVDEANGKKILDFIRKHLKRTVKKTNANNVQQDVHSDTDCVALLSEESHKDKPFMHFLKSTLHHLHYMKLVPNVILVVIDQNIQMKEDLPINLRSYTMVACKPPPMSNDFNKICKKLKETEHSSNNSVPIGNAGIGLAWNYYYGYLKLILPEMQKRIKQSEFYLHKDNMSTQFMVIIPEGDQTPGSFSDVSKRFHFEAPLDKGIEKARAGQPSRLYKNFVNQVKNEDKEYYFCGEFSTIVRALQKMKEEKSIDKSEMQKQIVLFRHTLKLILRQDLECRDQAHILSYEDPDTFADEIVKIISKQDEETPSPCTYQCNSRQTMILNEDKEDHDFEKSLIAFLGIVQRDAKLYSSFRTLEEKKLIPVSGDRDMDIEEGKFAEKLIIILTQNSIKHAEIYKNWLNAHETWYLRTTLVFDTESSVPDWVKQSNVEYKITQKCGNIWNGLIDSLYGNQSNIEEKNNLQRQNSTIDHLPSGNVAEGMVWAYYYNYVAIIGPRIEDRIKATSAYAQKKMPSTFFILLPYSGYCYTTLDNADTTHSITLDEKMSIADMQIAGNKRNYDATRYKITRGTEERYALVEYCASIHVLYEMELDGMASFTTEQKKHQLYAFRDILQKMLEESSYSQHFRLVCYDDATQPLVDVLWEAIEEALKEQNGNLPNVEMLA